MPPLATPSHSTDCIIPFTALASHDPEDREPPGTDARFAFFAGCDDRLRERQ